MAKTAGWLLKSSSGSKEILGDKHGVLIVKCMLQHVTMGIKFKLRKEMGG